MKGSLPEEFPGNHVENAHFKQFRSSDIIVGNTTDSCQKQI